MQRSGGMQRYSASDLVSFAACSHLTHLGLLNLENPLPKAEDTDEMVLVQEKRFAYEGRYWEHLRGQYPDAVDLHSIGQNDIRRDQATEDALVMAPAWSSKGPFWRRNGAATWTS